MKGFQGLITCILFIGIIICGSVFAETHYVAPNGSAPWTNSTNITTPCSLYTANINAVAGNTIVLRGGTYNTQIAPSNSGTSASRRIIYQVFNNESVIITKTGANGNGIFLDGNKYIKIDGIKFTDVSRLANIRNGASHIEITNCFFDGANTYNTHSAFHIWGQCSGGSPYTCPSYHNWIHGNTFAHSGYIRSSDCDDVGGNVYIGSPGTQGNNSNTFENNILSAGAHHLLETFSKFNVIRNNIFHNEGWLTNPGNCKWGPSSRNGKYGNRCVQLYDGANQGALFNLFEGNRLGYASFASDGGMDGNIVITSQGNIVRYNASYHSETLGIYFKQGANSNSSNNRVYNNTVYSSGQNSRTYPNSWTGYGEHDLRLGLYIANGNASRNNVIKNNIIYNSHTANIACDTTCRENNTIAANWTRQPLFVNPDISNPASLTLPNLTLQGNSCAVDSGTFLTQTNSTGTNTTTLSVKDALYFQDGTWGSALAGHQADWIAIERLDNVVKIKSIDYANNRITLETPTSWANNAAVWLYGKSDGTQVLHGSAPDMGAHEYPDFRTPGSDCKAPYKPHPFEVN